MSSFTAVCPSLHESRRAFILMVWYRERGQFPSVMVLRRYLKLALQQCRDLGIMDEPWLEVDDTSLPFKLSEIPTNYPMCSEMSLI